MLPKDSTLISRIGEMRKEQAEASEGQARLSRRRIPRNWAVPEGLPARITIEHEAEAGREVVIHG
jgi:hypothetical protein